MIKRAIVFNAINNKTLKIGIITSNPKINDKIIVSVVVSILLTSFSLKYNLDSRIRTCDPVFPKHVHYQAVLYPVNIKRVTRIELATLVWKTRVLPLNYTRIIAKQTGPVGFEPTTRVLETPVLPIKL